MKRADQAGMAPRPRPWHHAHMSVTTSVPESAADRMPGTSTRGESPSSHPYRGRFAPSPTGPLHFGSLVAALASWLDAKRQGGEWLVRMEDVDRPRTIAGAADAILRTLEACGLEWDGDVMIQSHRDDAYAAAFERLRREGRLFPCACTRREIADSAIAPPRPEGERIYPGTCRHGLPAGRTARAWRLRVAGTGNPDDRIIAFEDRVQGRIVQDLAGEVGDFVLRRADGLFAYQLAVVVDDAEQGITDIVRGADLLSSTPRQIFLQRLLGLPSPRYLHVPVAINAQGEKLSKQTRAHPVDDTRTGPTIEAALGFLGHGVPALITGAPPRELLAWARANWDVSRVPARRAIPGPPEVI